MKRIYFLRPVGQLGPIKIGCSVDPELRLETYIPWSPVKLELIATAAGGHAEERRLHGMFVDHWLHHEWFGASKQLLALIDHVLATDELPELPKVFRFPKLPHRKGRPGPRSKAGPAQKTLDFGNSIRAEYENGVGAEDLALRHGRSTSGILRSLRAVGVTIRDRGRPPGICGPQDIARAEAMAALYTSGKTLKEIGSEFGVSRERVRQILRAFAVPSLGHRPRQAA